MNFSISLDGQTVHMTKMRLSSKNLNNLTQLNWLYYYLYLVSFGNSILSLASSPKTHAPVQNTMYTHHTRWIELANQLVIVIIQTHHHLQTPFSFYGCGIARLQVTFLRKKQKSLPKVTFKTLKSFISQTVSVKSQQFRIFPVQKRKPHQFNVKISLWN